MFCDEIEFFNLFEKRFPKYFPQKFRENKI